MQDGMPDMKNISDNCFKDDGSIQKIKDGVKTIFLAPNTIKDENLDFTRRVVALAKGRARLLLDEVYAAFRVEGVE